MKKNHGPRFAKAYTKILRDPTLTPLEKCVWLVIKTYADKNGSAHPSKKTIADGIGITPRAVSLAITVLKEKRLLDWQPGFAGVSNFYLLTDEHYAKFLAKSGGTPVPSQVGTPVPTKKTQEEESPSVREVEPGKIIHLTCKPVHYRKRG